MTELHVIREPAPYEPALDTAISRALLLRVAAGELPATLRLARPAPAVVFGKQDAIKPGYAAAVQAARAGGFEPMLRLAGGRAAVFHEGTIALAHAIPDPTPRTGIHARFEATAALIAQALGGLGLDARVGEVPGEYCPGTYSVNARGERKLAGIGQRLIAGAAYLGGVLVVTDAPRVNDVLVPVYAALGLDWDPATTGAVADEPGFAPGEGPAPARGLPPGPPAGADHDDRAWLAVRDALLAEYARQHDLVEVVLDGDTLSLARRLAAEHRPA